MSIAVCALLVRHGALALRRALALCFLAILPPVVFLILFRIAGLDAFGNLSGLQQLAAEKSAGVGKLWHAMQLLGPAPLTLFLLGGLLNLRNARSLLAQVGLIALVLGIGGFVIFADCCSYDDRNGWWVVSFLMGSAAIGVMNLIPEAQLDHPRFVNTMKISARGVLTGGLAGALLFAGALGLLIPLSQARSIQLESEWQLAKSPALSNLMRTNIGLFAEADVIITPHYRLALLPGFKEKHRRCAGLDNACVRAELNRSTRVFILCTGSDYSEFQAALGKQTKVGEVDGMTLYGPIVTAALRIK